MKKMQSVVKKEAPKKEVKKKTCLVDERRSQKINICLKKISLEPLDVLEAMESFDETVLTPFNCELLEGILPKKQENEKVANYTGDLSDLDEPSQFVLLIGGLIGYEERIKAILFQNDFEDDYELIMNEIDRFFSVFRWLKNDEDFKEWLTIILAFGNYINGNTFRGGALGFDFQSLLNLIDVKNKNNNMNLLQYIVKFVHDNLKKEELFKVIDKLKQFDKMQFDYITETAKNMEQNFNSMTKLKEVIEKNKDQLGENDGSEKFLNNCYEDTKNCVEEVMKKIQEIQNEYKEILAYFGQNPKTEMDTFIKCFRNFTDQLEKANNWYIEFKKKREKEEKKKKKIY
jgi:hypothetical protein